MTRYKLYYWLYAFLNKIYGKTLIFTRDSLHSRYAVNRHSFSITSNNKTFDLKAVFENMSIIIGKSYSIREKKVNYISFDVSFNKKNFYINLSYSPAHHYLGKNFPSSIDVMIF